MKFSIITVCYNEEKKIQSTIESVLCQKWKTYEHIVIDGQSSDSTMEIVRRFADQDTKMRWYSERDSGIYNAMNKGIHYAEGDYICFLNAGDVFYSNDVLEKIAVGIQTTNADIVFGDRIRRTESGHVNVSGYFAGTALYDNLRNRKNVCHQTIFASKDSLKDGFDEQYKICADYDWLCRQVISGLKTAKVDSVVVDFDTHGITSQSQYQKIGLKESLRVVRKYFPEMGLWNYSEVEELLLQKIKSRILYKCINQWLILKQKGVLLSSFFTERNLYNIAIYGFHYMGQRLYEELKDSPVKVAYAIDKNNDAVVSDLPIMRKDANLNEVDAIIVTPVIDFLEIREELVSKVKCPIISIEEILYAI